MNVSNNRTIMLERIPGTKPLTDKHEKDYRIFLEATPLHAVRNDNTNLWSMHYTPPAVIPESLRQQFTRFDLLVDHARSYFSKRNIQIKEIVYNGV